MESSRRTKAVIAGRLKLCALVLAATKAAGSLSGGDGERKEAALFGAKIQRRIAALKTQSQELRRKSHK
jgi:hypothetical protein